MYCGERGAPYHAPCGKVQAFPDDRPHKHHADIITDCGGLLLRPCDDMQDIPDDVPDDELRGIVREWLIRQAFVTDGGNIRAVDERIVKLVSEIREHRHLEERISEIAQQCCLSESRRSHIFR